MRSVILAILSTDPASTAALVRDAGHYVRLKLANAPDLKPDQVEGAVVAELVAMEVEGLVEEGDEGWSFIPRPAVEPAQALLF